MYATYGSRPSTSAAPEIQDSTQESSKTEDSNGKFIPNVINFISLARRAAANALQKGLPHVPDLYLESQAVDGAVFIGEGATFSVFRRAIPAHKPRQTFSDMGGWTSSSTESTQKRPKYVVYKTTNIRFTRLGTPDERSRRAMDSALTEIHALGHGPLRDHPNIVQLLGLAWSTNVFATTQRLPTIVAEYAEYGSLRSFQASNTLSHPQMQNFSLDIANGLLILHECGLVHGDVKDENILIFPHEKRKYIAKIADFGFSRVGASADDHVTIGGTFPWKAPESIGLVSRELLHKTDIYSFGLLVWSMVVGGLNPFKLIIPSERHGDTFEQEISRLKNEDSLVEKSVLTNWLPNYLETRSPISLQNIWKHSTYGNPTLQWASAILKQQKIYGGFDLAMESCLRKDPALRDLVKAKSALMEASPKPLAPSDAPPGVASSSTNPLNKPSEFPIELAHRQKTVQVADQHTKNPLSHVGSQVALSAPTGEVARDKFLSEDFRSHSFSWETVNDLSPDIQNLVAQTLKNREQENFERGKINPPECLLRAAMLINGCGTEVDERRACDLFMLCVRNKYNITSAYAWRVVRACGFTFDPPDSPVGSLRHMAYLGSRTALQDLWVLDPQRAQQIKGWIKESRIGTGSNFFEDHNLLLGNTFGSIDRFLNDVEGVRRKCQTQGAKTNIRVDRRGDSLFHLACACGKLGAVQTMIDEIGDLDVDSLNDEGETALLYACRAGHVDIVETLLANDANARIVTPYGESPLHWLISFDPEEAVMVGEILIAHGADIGAMTTRDTHYSVFPGRISIDHESPGTPLAWAVHNNRPDIISFILKQPDGVKLCHKKFRAYRTPLEIAAHEHHTECFRLMVQAHVNASTFYLSSPILRNFLNGANRFTAMLRHGITYKENLAEFLEFLLVDLKRTVPSGIYFAGDTLLFHAVKAGAYEVVEFLLSRGIELVEQFSNERSAEEEMPPDTTQRSDLNTAVTLPGVFTLQHINYPCGESHFYPIHAAVERNSRRMFDKLVENGADIFALARNPFTRDQLDWTVLHVLSHARQDQGTDLAEHIVARGLPIDGVAPTPRATETPLLVAIQHDCFELASKLIELGADINALGTGAGHISVKRPLTLLGLIIASASRNSVPRLRFILSECSVNSDVDFIVEPEGRRTALHVAARAYRAVLHRSPDITLNVPVKREDCNMHANREILYELLQEFSSPEQRDRRETLGGATALHFAVDARNVDAVALLLESGANARLADNRARTPLGVAEGLLRGEASQVSGREELTRIVELIRSRQT